MILSTLNPEGSVDPMDLFTFDCCFDYETYNPPKRTKVTATSKGSFKQTSLPLYLHGTHVFKWNLITTCDIAQELSDMDATNGLYEFTGAYGEEYLVDFQDFKKIAFKGLWKITGTFRVVCIITDINTCEQCP